MSEGNSSVMNRAEQLLRDRLEVIGGLESAYAEVEQAQARAAAAEKALKDAVSAAKSAGWTDAELRTIGIPLPSGRAPRAKKSTQKA